MRRKTFAELHGFTADPFAETNSENEALLDQYFVPPPYFTSVVGDPENPRPKVVFAPRGTGKTAQRRMIESQSMDPDLPFVCLTYDTFDVSKGTELSLEAHLVALCKLLCIIVLEYLERSAMESIELSDHEKRIIKVASQTFLGTMSESEYATAYSAIKSFTDKAGEVWKKYGGILAAAVNAVMKKAGIDDINVPVKMAEEAKNTSTSAAYYFRQLVDIVIGPLRGGSIYVLIDKVDETSKTSTTAASAWSLISALITDLNTVEAPGIAFKFFLWDQLDPYFRSEGGRPDRLLPVRLKWTLPELEFMLTRRLEAFSDNHISSFNEIYDESSNLDAHKLLAYLSGFSPRDMIRMAESIAAEHTRSSSEPHRITENELLVGVRTFCEVRSLELYPMYFADFKKVGEPSFTINKLANFVFNVSGEAARSKVQKWMSAGAVTKVGQIANRKNKPLNLYAFEDPRLMIATNSQQDVIELLDNYALECPSCKRILLTAETKVNCPSCGAVVDLALARSLLEIVTRGGKYD